MDKLKEQTKQVKSLYQWPDQKPNITPEVNGWFTGASAAVLKHFIQGLKPRFIVELGSWTGTGSTKFLLEHAPDSHILCFDHWSPNVNDHGNSGTTTYAENDPELLQLPKIWDSFIYNTWEHRHHLTPIRAKTPAGLESVKSYDLLVDLIFIDADHSYEGVTRDIMMCYENWPNAQLTGDDYTWDSVKRAVNDCAKKLDKRVIFYHNCWFFTDEIAFEVNF